ncbi:unnamed protein product [Leptosia nina]|uniref:Longin domain-containing protein n=1 Tax=Leptosia nina TaxID=320188 RepID=A0AAV1JSI6_9NEOP
MPILFSAIALSRVVLEKFATCDGNFEDIAEEVVSKIPVCDNKLTYSHGRYLLHYIKEVECVFFCITDRTCQRSRAFFFLNEIRRQYEKNGSDIAKILAHEMYRYNEDYGTIVIRSGELEELNSIGVESSECILGEKMLFVENDHNLRYTTTSYTDAPQTVEVSEDDLLTQSNDC